MTKVVVHCVMYLPRSSFPSSIGRPTSGSYHSDMFVMLALGGEVVSCQWMEQRMKTNHNIHHGSFWWRTGWASHYLGLPLCISLSHSSPSSIPSIKRIWAAHIPLERGGVDAVGSAFPNVLHLDLSPHPSIEGRGLVLGICVWLEANRGGEDEGGGSGMGGGWMNLNCDGVYLSFKLRSPSKITFNINAG